MLNRLAAGFMDKLLFEKEFSGFSMILLCALNGVVLLPCSGVGRAVDASHNAGASLKH